MSAPDTGAFDTCAATSQEDEGRSELRPWLLRQKKRLETEELRLRGDSTVLGETARARVRLDLAQVHDCLGQGYLAHAWLVIGESDIDHDLASAPLLHLRYRIALVESYRELGRLPEATSAWGALAAALPEILSKGAASAPRRALQIARLVKHALGVGWEHHPPQDALKRRWFFEQLEMSKYVGTAPLYARLAQGRAQGPASLGAQAALIQGRIDRALDSHAGAQTWLRSSPEGLRKRASTLLEESAAWDRLALEFAATQGPDPVQSVDAGTAAGALERGDRIITLTRFQCPGPPQPWQAFPQPPSSYLAQVMDEKGRIELVYLGSAAEVEQLARNWLGALQACGPRAELERAQRVAGTRLRGRCLDSALEALGWPLPGARVYLRLDGILEGVPWAALPSGRSGGPTAALGELSARLGQRFQIIRVDSIARLIDAPMAGESTGQGAQPSVLLVGGVDYGAAPGQDPRGPSGESRRDATGPGLPRGFRWLAGAQQEIAAAAWLAHEQLGVQPVRLEGEHVTKMRLHGLARGKTFIHLASHSARAGAPWEATSRGPVNASTSVGDPECRDRTFEETCLLKLLSAEAPLGRSGIVMAGANGQKTPSGQLSCLMSSRDVRAMELVGCELLVLATCASHRPEDSRGWDPESLPAAALQAGARSVLYCLWDVDDELNADFMSFYYGALWKQGMPPQDALRSAQESMSKGNYAPRSWAGWTLAGAARP